jgi:hypothetical protein
MRLSVLSFVFAVLAAGIARSQSAVPPWELRPYRITVLVAVQPGPELPAAVEGELHQQIGEQAAAAIGDSWTLKVEAASAELKEGIIKDIAAVEAAAFSTVSKDADKVTLLVADSKTGGGIAIHAREYDVLTGLWNAPVSVQSSKSELPQAAFRAVLDAFAPLARIESVDGDTVMLRLRAGALPMADKALPRIQPGVAFRPVLVASEARGVLKPGTAQPLAWTYLAPRVGTTGLVSCRVHTAAAANPIPAYHPLRQRLAIGVAPSSRGTQLKLVGRGEKGQPLEGYEVLGEEDPGDATALKSLVRSDEHGLASVPPSPQALRVLVVQHGEQPLSRFPLAPGLQAELTLPLPDVRGAIALDAQIAELEDDIIDLTLRKQVLAARLNSAGADAALQEQLKARLAKFPKPDALAARLQQFEQAAKSAEPLAQPRLLGKLAAIRKLLESIGP